MKLLPTPIKSRSAAPEFEPKEYDIGEMRVFIIDNELYKSKADDMVCFEL
jgi:hypothetical protein